MYGGVLLSGIFKCEQSRVWIWPQQLYQRPGQCQLYRFGHHKFMRMVVQCRILWQQCRRQYIVRGLWSGELLYRWYASRDMRQHGKGRFANTRQYRQSVQW